jgi:hypothetical protein
MQQETADPGQHAASIGLLEVMDSPFFSCSTNVLAFHQWMICPLLTTVERRCWDFFFWGRILDGLRGFPCSSAGTDPRIVVPTRTLLQSQHRLGQPPARTGAEADPGQGPRTTCVLCLPWLYCSCFLSFIIAVHLHAEIGSAQNLWVFRKHLIVTCSWFTLYMCYAQCRHRL